VHVSTHMNSRRCSNKQSLCAGNLLHMKQAKSLFRMDFHKSAHCLDGDVEIRSIWTLCFTKYVGFECYPEHWWKLKCVSVDMDSRPSGKYHVPTYI